MTKQTDIDFYRALLRADLLSFAKLVFRTLYPDRPFEQNWHHEVIADRLAKVAKRNITRLIVNQPPRSAKSTFASIAFPLWLLLRDPSLEILCISYGDELGRQFAEHSKRFIESSVAQRLFPGVWRASGRNNEIGTRRGGRRYSVSAGGAITGQGADVIIIDDPLKASEAQQKARENINAWYSANIYQRLNNKNTGAIVLVQQRLHLEDLSGYLLSKAEPWDHLALRSIAEGYEEWTVEGHVRWTRPRGCPLHPEMESLDRLAQVRAQIGGQVFEAQYQQNPAPSKQVVLQEDWFGRYEDFEICPPNLRYAPFENVVQAWDTASTVQDSSDYSVGVTMGSKDGKFYILDVIRDKLEFPDLLRKVRETGESTYFYDREIHISKIIVEDAGTGTALIQALRDENLPITAVKPATDKLTRLLAVSGLVESGLVHIPEEADWVDPFLLELCRFPNTKHDDQVDAFAYSLDELRKPSKWMYRNLQPW